MNREQKRKGSKKLESKADSDAESKVERHILCINLLSRRRPGLALKYKPGSPYRVRYMLLFCEAQVAEVAWLR